MKLIRARIDGFGKLKDREIVFGEHLTILSGENEAGKSTMHAFLRCMLFGQERGRGRAARTDDFTRFRPWADPQVYGGSLVFSDGQQEYLLTRSFARDEVSLSNITTGEQLDPARDLPALLEGLTKARYDNTLSIGQVRGETDQALLAEIQNHFGALRDTGSASLRLEAAAASVKKYRRSLEKTLHPVTRADAERLEAEIAALDPQAEAAADAQAAEAAVNVQAQAAEDPQELRERIRTGQAAYDRTSRRLADAEEILEQAGVEDEEAAQTEIRRFENAWDARRAHRPYAGEHGAEKGLRALSDVFYYVMLVIFLIAEMFFLQKNYIPFALLFLGAALVYLVSRFLDVRRENMAVYRRADDYVRDVLERRTGTRRVSPEQVEQVREDLESEAELFERVRRLRRETAERAEELVTLRAREADLHDEQLTRRQQAWEQQQAQQERARTRRKREEELAAVRRQLEEDRHAREEIEACDLALQTYDEISARIRGTYGGPLSEAASRVLEGVTGGAYRRLLYDQDGRPSVMDGDRRVPVEQLSRGTGEQVWLSLRIGAASMFWPDLSMPLLLDDCFAFYDADRLLAALRYLALDYPGQVIVFTCHDREGEICEAQHLPHEHVFLG